VCALVDQACGGAVIELNKNQQQQEKKNQNQPQFSLVWEKL
jgi:hypothetical protein